MSLFPVAFSNQLLWSCSFVELLPHKEVNILSREAEAPSGAIAGAGPGVAGLRPFLSVPSRLPSAKPCDRRGQLQLPP